MLLYHTVFLYKEAMAKFYKTDKFVRIFIVGNVKTRI